MIRLERILVPTDFSDNSARARDYAHELAKRFEAEVHLLHIVEPLTLIMPSPGAPIPDEVLADSRRAAEKQLQDWLPSDSELTKPVLRDVERGTPFVEIIRYAREKAVDLIVMGTHGRTGITHALIGSVAERVVRKSPCPVLTVRAEGHQFVMP